ncbi:MAG: ankyrin repeat domain-containing protein [Spirochaetia bacterium]|nr:ankyrin repeat domain-containing protein [Spirochaetia bacterium]
MELVELQEKLFAECDGSKDGKKISSLVKDGANLHAVDDYGLSPLMRAALFNSNAKVIEALVASGSDVFYREPQYKSTALQLASNHNPNPGIIESLVKAGSDLHDVNYLGETALIMAVNSGNSTKVISALIRCGSDVNARDYQDKSALDYALTAKRPYVVKILRAAGAIG